MKAKEVLKLLNITRVILHNYVESINYFKISLDSSI